MASGLVHDQVRRTPAGSECSAVGSRLFEDDSNGNGTEKSLKKGAKFRSAAHRRQVAGNVQPPNERLFL